MNKEKHYTLYVLKLEQSKWYVGITSQAPEKRFQEHLGNRKSYWTEKYPPIKIVDTKYLGDLSLEDAKLYENKVVRKYIEQKGINNVRGGDITDKTDMVVRFGYIFDQLTWEAMTIIVLQTLTIIWLVLDKY